MFFAKVMEDTDTIITWPNKLKIGAKSKKGISTRLPHLQLKITIFSLLTDPHVRIAGRPEDVQNAKDRILTVLNTRVGFSLLSLL